MGTPGGFASLADIVVHLKAGVDGFKRDMQAADEVVGRMWINLGRLNALGGHGIAVYTRFGLTLGQLAQIAGVTLLVNQMRRLLGVGQAFNVQLEQMVLGIKAVVATNTEVDEPRRRRLEASRPVFSFRGGERWRPSLKGFV